MRGFVVPAHRTVNRTPTIAGGGGSPLIAGLTLDAMEWGMRTVASPPGNVWQNNIGGGAATIVTSQHYDGTSALQVTHATGSDSQTYFYTYTESQPGFGDGWKYIYRFVENPTVAFNGWTWTQQTYNRLRFRALVDPGYGYSSSAGNHNWEIGTFLANPEGAGGPDTDNNHWYHFLDFKGHASRWWEVILDQHPEHIRGANGDAEQPLVTNPYTGKNYWDAMVAFYIDIPFVAVAGRTCWYDGFEFYTDTDDETYIRGLRGMYDPGTNEINFGWGTDKDSTATFDVKYSFTSIQAGGWASGTAAPSGTGLTRGGTGGNNQMRYVNTTITMTGHDWVCMAVRESTHSTFREIWIPLT